MDALKFYSQGLSQTEDCGIIFEIGGKILFVNDTYLRQRGLRKEDVIGIDIFDAIEPSEIPLLKNAIGRSARSTHMAEIVLRMRTRDGSGFRQVRWQGMEILTPAEQPNIVVAQGKLLHPLGNNDDSGMGFTITADGTILDISESICTMCGYTREEVLATNTSALYYSTEDRRTIKAQLRRGGIERGQITLRCKNGSPINFLYTAQLMHQSKGSPRIYSGYFIPSGDQHSSRLAKDFSPVVHALPDIAWVQGRDHRIVTANDAYYSAFGLERNKVIGHTESDFMPDNIARDLIQAAIHLFKERREIITPMARHFTDKDKWYRIVRRPVFDEGTGDVIGLVGICKDISKEVERETEFMQELREQETDSLIVIDSEGRIIRSTTILDPPVLSESLGQSYAQDLTKIVDILHPDDLPRAQEVMRKVLTRKKPVSLECRIRNLRRRFSTVFIRAHYNDEFFGEPRMYVTVRDLSRAKLLRTPDKVLDRLKNATGSATYKELAAFLNVTSASISNAKKNDRIPPDWLVSVGTRTGTSVDWLLTGLGQPSLAQR